MSQEFLKRILSSIVLIPMVLFFIIKGSLIFTFFITICFLITIYEWHIFSKKKFYSFFGYVFIFFSFLSLYKLRINSENDYWYLLFIIIICVATDIGGYVFGKIFKGPKLSKISPNKTYSGMIGGFLLSIISVYIFMNNFLPTINTQIDWFILALLISCISQLGDIIISLFKRIKKIKDTGKIIPGHGGLLDRIDGMIFAFPFSYIIFLTDLI
jgi:phosphatidate cytidylyltransferase